MRKSLGEYPIRRLRRELEDDIKMDLKYGGLMQLPRDLVLWQSLVLLAPKLVPIQNLPLPLCTLISDLFDRFIF